MPPLKPVMGATFGPVIPYTASRKSASVELVNRGFTRTRGRHWDWNSPLSPEDEYLQYKFTVAPCGITAFVYTNIPLEVASCGNTTARDTYEDVEYGAPVDGCVPKYMVTAYPANVPTSTAGDTASLVPRVRVNSTGKAVFAAVK
jgi:hypothetical protein